MPSALRPGRPTRFRPSGRHSTKPPECAGVYYIYNAEGDMVYAGQSVNLRRRVYEHKRRGKIPDDGYVDCFKAKDGITFEQLNDTEREKIKKYNPPLNQRGGGGGRTAISLRGYPSKETDSISTSPTEQVPEKKRNYLYRLLRYEKVDKAGEVHYLKEPKALFFMVIELTVKILLINTILLTFLGVYLKFAKGVLLNQQMIIGMIVIPIVCFVLFHYIRRNKFYKAMIIISSISSIVLYLTSYPVHIKWPFQ